MVDESLLQLSSSTFRIPINTAQNIFQWALPKTLCVIERAQDQK